MKQKRRGLLCDAYGCLLWVSTLPILTHSFSILHDNRQRRTINLSSRQCNSYSTSLNDNAQSAEPDNPRDEHENEHEDNQMNEHETSRISEEEAQSMDHLLDYAIDSFLSGDYAYQFSPDAPYPHPSLSAGETVEVALRALRQLNHPEPAHGAAVFGRFCLPLSRAERWGASRDVFKQVLRGGLTPEMLAKRLRASAFCHLLDWTKLDVTEGTTASSSSIVSNLAFVNAALYFGQGVEPSLIQFTLKRISGGVWMIDTARQSPMELFVTREDVV